MRFFKALLSFTIFFHRINGALIGLLCALFLSAFIYLEHFLGDGNVPLYSTILAILGLFLYLRLSHLGAFVCGGALGVLWFYWVGLSFRFYEISYLIPFVWIAFFGVYGILFYGLCYFKNPIYRIATLVLSSYIHPFGFNWFIIEAIFVKSYFFPSKLTLFLLLCGLAIFSVLLTFKSYKISFVWLILCCVMLPANVATIPSSTALKIKTTRFDIPQNLRWRAHQVYDSIAQNFQAITTAKAEGYDVVILPETAFPLPLNLQPTLLEQLKEESQGIAILTGAIYQDVSQENARFFNSAYLFQDGDMQIFHKQILVPFGEKIPLPDFIAKWVNQVFFGGASDFDVPTSKVFNSAWIKNQKFQIAICYEATREEFYQNSPSNLIAISNNAWFAPSIEPTLQKLLMLYFAKNHGTRIYHSSNASEDFAL